MYTPQLLDELVIEFEGYDLDVAWDLIYEKFRDANLANDVVAALSR